MFILKKGHQPGVYVPLRALFLVFYVILQKRIYLLKRILHERALSNHIPLHCRCREQVKTFH